MIRVLVTDDEDIVRAGLRGVLGTAEDIEVVGEAGSGAEAVEAVRRQDADVVLLDFVMPGALDGAAVAGPAPRAGDRRADDPYGRGGRGPDLAGRGGRVPAEDGVGRGVGRGRTGRRPAPRGPLPRAAGLGDGRP
ncbi:response regulator transcription factor [Streptomyces sp. NPDC048337]|uniref:response regulator transcription factor n=1 Tax=Streptomyces sp. NPDC048337 TaxID=3365535 RepID=UPI00371FA0B8